MFDHTGNTAAHRVAHDSTELLQAMQTYYFSGMVEHRGEVQTIDQLDKRRYQN